MHLCLSSAALLWHEHNSHPRTLSEAYIYYRRGEKLDFFSIQFDFFFSLSSLILEPVECPPDGIAVRSAFKKADLFEGGLSGYTGYVTACVEQSRASRKNFRHQLFHRDTTQFDVASVLRGFNGAWPAKTLNLNSCWSNAIVS